MYAFSGERGIAENAASGAIRWGCSFWSGLPRKALDQAERNDYYAPGQAERDSESVEVSLSDSRRSHAGSHATAEHVRHTAAATLMQQDQQRQQQAGDAQQYQQDDTENFHSDLSA